MKIKHYSYDFYGRKIISEQEIIDRQMTILSLFLTKPPPRNWVESSYFVLSDHDECWEKLHRWVIDNQRPEFNYSTGSAIIEAAETIATSQIENGGECLEKGKSDENQ